MVRLQGNIEQLLGGGRRRRTRELRVSGANRANDTNNRSETGSDEPRRTALSASCAAYSAVAFGLYHSFCLPTVLYLLIVCRPVWQMIDAPNSTFISIQYGRKFSVAAVVNPLLGYRESDEPREAGPYGGANGNPGHGSPGGVTA